MHDLFVSKWVAGRDKDNAFCRALGIHGLVEEGTLRERLAATALADDRVRPSLEARLARWLAER